MNYLLDTHVLLWSVISPNKLSERVREILYSAEGTKFVSALSLWEISLKYSIGKLELKPVSPLEFLGYIKKSGFKTISLTPETASSFYNLQILKNRDPFDLMLAWQVIRGGYFLLSKDKEFDIYQKDGLKRIW